MDIRCQLHGECQCQVLEEFRGSFSGTIDVAEEEKYIWIPLPSQMHSVRFLHDLALEKKTYRGRARYPSLVLVIQHDLEEKTQQRTTQQKKA